MSNLEFHKVALRNTGIGKALKYILALSAITAASVLEVGNYNSRNDIDRERVEFREKIDELMEQNKNADRQSKIITEILKEMIAGNEAQAKRLDLQGKKIDELLKTKEGMMELFRELVKGDAAITNRLDRQDEWIRQLKKQIEGKK